MSLKSFIKIMLRSRSFNVAKILETESRGTVKLNLKHKDISLQIRTGTADTTLVEEMLIKNDKKCPYYVPISMNPGVILDIGANIGVSALYFKRCFPKAKIYCFEPFPENINLLKKNVQKYNNVTVIGKALFNTDGFKTYYFSDSDNNFGGGTFKEIGHNSNRKYELETVSYSKAVERYNIPNKVDIIKIDTEGSEHEILTDIPENVIKDVSYVTGELHGIKEFETLAYLSNWFNIGMKKKASKRLFNFYAINKKIKESYNI